MYKYIYIYKFILYIYIYIFIYIIVIYTYRISSNKPPQRLLNFETFRCGANQREKLISKLWKWTTLNVKTL